MTKQRNETNLPESAKIAALQHSLIFSGLEGEPLQKLARLAEERAFTPGRYIFQEGDAPEWFYVILAGQVKAVKQSAQGKDFIIAFFSPGEMFGEVAVFEDRPYPASAQAVVPTRVLRIRGKDFLAFLTRQPEIALRIISILGSRLREAQGRLKDLASERVEQRIARILLMLQAKFGTTLPFTRQEVADMAGTTTETAIRVLGRLKEGNIIRSARGKITILDQTKLRLLAEGPPSI